MKKVKNVLKSNRFIYYIYNIFFSILLKFIGIFIRIDKNVILFNSFGGKKYDDNPKAIYEYMINQKKYDGYKFYWVFDNPQKFDIIRGKKIKNNTFKFFITALRAKYWITNSGIERGLKFKKKNTIYINTWHGSVIKKIGKAFKNERFKFNVSTPDYYYAQSEIDREYFSKQWDFPKERMLLSGYPRNDTLCNIKIEEIKKIKKKLNIPFNKKVIIYAPTFRDFDFDKNGCYIAPPINIQKWEEMLSNKYVILFRSHYEINKSLNIEDNDFIKNVTDYPYLDELLKISDILISDYSSIMIDYSILERPIFCFAYDYEKYCKERGTAYDLETELPNGVIKSENELINQILNCEYDKQKIKTRRFKEKHVEVYGNASSYIDNLIL